MQKFDLLRYLKRFGLVVLAITIVGTSLVYLYCKNNQYYTAKASIRYTNDNVNMGLNPDGSELDVNEIYSSSVIAQAMDSLGLTTSLNVIRSSCFVEGIVPEEEKTKSQALLDKGEDVKYVPDEYEVGLTVSGKYGSSYARNVLDAILQSYFNVYTEKYVEQRLELNPSEGLLESGYDFYECVYILENDTNEMLNFLTAKKANYPHFRSSVTGYSYADLCDIYQEFKDFVIPSLYARVIDGPQVIDGDLLRKSLTNEIKDMARDEENKSDRRDYLYKLITNYSDKNKDILEYHYNKQTTNDETDYILKQVEDNYDQGDIEIVYDKLINEYVSLDKEIRQSEITRGYKTYLLSVFGDIGSGGSGTEKQHAALADKINMYEKKLYDYYDVVSKTSKEFNNVLSANYLKMENSITVSPSINAKLYIVIGFVFFLVAGLALAVVLGRVSDFAKYLLYTDKKTGLANREHIDIFIEETSKDILPDNYACIYLFYTSLFDHTKKYGYKVADNILKDFAGLVNSMGDEHTFIGYNGAGRFVAFLPQCNARRAEAILDVFAEQVREYNNLNPDYTMEYKATFAVTSDDGEYEIRHLFRAAMNKTQKKDDAPKQDAPKTDEEAKKDEDSTRAQTKGGEEAETKDETKDEAKDGTASAE